MVLTLVTSDDGEVADETLQALSMARDLADQTREPLEAVAFGSAGEAATTLGEHGVDTLYDVAHDSLELYSPRAWAESVSQLLEDTGADAVVAPGNDRGAEVLAHLGAKRDLPMAAECVDVTAGEPYELTRQRWGGTLLEHATLEAATKLLTVAPNEVSASAVGGEATVEEFTPELSSADLEVTCSAVETADEEGVPLSEARVVVGGGRGTDGDFAALEELAERIPNAAVGSSRAVVNEGWRPHDDQIGQTGTKIAPDVYIACGISGAVQHMVGCKGADHILAVNTDPEAAIIGHSDWAVVADLHEVVPAVVEELDERD